MAAPVQGDVHGVVQASQHLTRIARSHAHFLLKRALSLNEHFAQTNNFAAIVFLVLAFA
ncbi:hypothetical protein OWR29_04485 [Actinoplanes sp. Pm04-4]|uniref:Uncharacterized protein n=1 Tax=Paractinoplanes pyxinae TaxID=2997416 RepID=A0ABT4ASM6_9ACTN|nr:hypothetical protein [Actinoplanes pyxinae]MCY1137246.1 hypothetical protein [Actinoplanes pyxinae]